MGMNTEITSFGLEIEDTFDPSEVQEGLDHRKISTSNLESIAQVYITDHEVIISSGSNGFACGEGGNIISGPSHFTNYPSDIHIGSFWRFNDELLTTLPSTVYTPIPVLKYEEPQFSKSLQKILNILGK